MAAEIDISDEAVRALAQETQRMADRGYMEAKDAGTILALLAQRDAALARAEKVELVNECHCVNVEALTTERDTAEAQLTTALARVAELEAEAQKGEGK